MEDPTKKATSSHCFIRESKRDKQKKQEQHWKIQLKKQNKGHVKKQKKTEQTAIDDLTENKRKHQLSSDSPKQRKKTRK